MENWQDVPGYIGSYQVSSLGRVKSCARTVVQDCGGAGLSSRIIKERILRSGSRFGGGYKGVMLCKHGVMSAFTVHKLVMLSFVGPRPDGYEINHIDGDKSNNSLSNLGYVTPLQNRHHAFKVLHKDKHRNRKIPVSEHVEIVHRYLGGESQASIGRTFGTTYSPIRVILRKAGIGPKRKCISS